MKQYKTIFRNCWLILMFVFSTCHLFAADEQISKMDSIEISLITCTPHEEIYSLYGHTAIRHHNLSTGLDIVFNYGVFNFQAPHFVTRFVLGKTDYELGIVPMKPFCEYYKNWGSEVIEQVLNLTNEEKARISFALSLNLRPENRFYRYNFFYDNCSTRPRDIIENNILGEIVYSPRKGYEPTYRMMLHELSSHHEWATFGNDALLGVKADQPTTRRQQEFLPMNLMYDFDHAQIYKNGEYRPLVKERHTLVKAGVQLREPDFPLSPTACALFLLGLALIIAFYESKKSHLLIAFDIVLMLTTGLLGCLLFIMIFSEHPATSINLQLLLFNPLSLFFIPSVVRRKPTHYWKLLSVCIVLFFIGGFFQDYAEGMEILALCLLTRFWSHYKNEK